MIPLSSHLHCFQWDICFIPYLYSSANNMSFIHLTALKIFSLSLVLKTFIVICLGIIFSMFLVLEVFWDSWIYGFKVVTKYGGEISPLYLQMYFWTHPFNFRDSNYTCNRQSEVIPQITDNLFIFFTLFFFLCVFPFE